MLKWIEMAIGTVLLCVIAWVGYRLAFSKVELDVYRDRLAGLSSEYESLLSMYNQAVRKTAVTELIVKDGRVSLAIRTIDGVDRVIDTPFDPSLEIYCDYVLLNGRLWIRRVYDSHTPPNKGLVIDDTLEHVDWNDPAARYGNAVYRSLGEGRWIVTVTGDGSLGLVKTDAKADVVLSGPPPVRDYDQLDKQINEAMADVTCGDVLKRIFKLDN
ncbi:MAG: hypothetical protein HQ546_07595 [Planctomycetes bacterium]|nr:hypothetical protein [Planctomycetota bacterium]